MDAHEELANRAVELAAAGQRHEAWAQLDEVLGLLVDERTDRAPSDEHLELELWVRNFRRACDDGDNGAAFLPDAEAELALWDEAVERFGRAAVGEAFISSLVSIGRDALSLHSLAQLSRDEEWKERVAEIWPDVEVPNVDELLLRVRNSIVDMCANYVPPGVLHPDDRSEATAYVDARTLQADIEAEFGNLDQSVATLREVIALAEQWGSDSSHSLSKHSGLDDPFILSDYVSRCVEAGFDDERLAYYHAAWVDLLEREYAAAADAGDEMNAAAWITFMRTAAELATPTGRRAALPDLAARIDRCTRDLAARGSVAGQVLLGDLPETLAWVESLARGDG
jgi:hypothetical protein